MKRLSTPLVNVLFASFYFFAGKLGLSLAFVHESATAVWPPTGLSLAAVLLLGYRVCPGIFVGAFLVNFTTGHVPFGGISWLFAKAFGIATGNMLEALLGAWLIQRFAGGARTFEAVRNIPRFTLICAASTALCASIGMVTLGATGFALWRDFSSIWLTWWLGDLVSAFVVAPLVLVWWLHPRPRWPERQWLEAGALLLLVFLVNQMVFGGWFPSRIKNYPLEYAGIPLLLWAAFRFTYHGAVTVVMLMSGVAIFGTLRELGPFATSDPNDSLLLLQAFMGIISLSGLVLASVVSERQSAQEKLTLYHEIFAHSTDGIAVIDPQGRYLEQNAAHEALLGYSHSELREKTPAIHLGEESFRLVAQELAEKGQYRGELTSRTRTGKWVTLDLSAFSMRDEQGKPLYFVGIKRDVSLRKQAEAALRFQKTLLEAQSEASIDGILVVASDGRLLSYNRRFVQMWAIPEEVLTLGSDEAALRWVKDKVLQPEEFLVRVQYLYGHADLTSRDEIVLRDGRVFERYSAPVKSSDGMRYGRIWFFRDITERKRVEEELKRESGFRRTIENSIPAGLAVVDLQGKQTYVNPAFCEMVGWSEHELLNQSPPFPYWPPEAQEAIARSFEATMTGQAPASGFELKFRRRNEERFDALVLISPMKNSAGGVTGWLASVSDITHLKAVERQALKRLHHLEQIYELSEIVNRAEVIEQIYETALDVLMQTVGSNRSAIFLSDAAGQMQFKAWRGFSDEFRRDMARYTPWKSGTADPQPFFLPDVASESFDPEMNSVLQREGVGGLAWIPLVYQKRLLGQFILAYNVAHDFRDEERHLIQTIAAQLAFAIARKQSEEALRESERWLRLIAENTTDVIFAFDMQRRLLYANPALVQLTGYSAAEIRERRFINWIHPEDQERMLNLWDLLYQGKGYEGEEFRLITKQGKMKWSLSSWGPLYDESGHQIGVQGRERDITERKMAEEALQKARQKLREYAEELERRVAQRTAALQESNEQMEAFCYSVSHDLRAPLRAMQGFTRALVEDYQGVLDEVGRDYAQRVATAAQRMDRLIQDLLEYSRLGRMDLEVTACAVRPLLDTALAQLASEIREKQATVTLVEPLRAVLANKTLLEQVFVNLISNALKFVAPGTAPQVRIWSEETESSIRLFIQDNGIGIDPMHQERIFRVFERLHGFDAYPGTGIGLAIVRKGIERMGGQVGLTSQPSQGSCFWIALAKANLPATD